MLEDTNSLDGAQVIGANQDKVYFVLHQNFDQLNDSWKIYGLYKAPTFKN